MPAWLEIDVVIDGVVHLQHGVLGKRWNGITSRHRVSYVCPQKRMRPFSVHTHRPPTLTFPPGASGFLTVSLSPRSMSLCMLSSALL
jgi:hypothetical protein